MNISVGQLLCVILVGFILFGDVGKLVRNVGVMRESILKSKKKDGNSKCE